MANQSDFNRLWLSPGEEGGGAENGDEPSGDSGVSRLQAELAKVQAQAKENHERYIYQLAEFENLRKRTHREKEETRKYANEDLLRELLGVVDNLERAVASQDPTHLANPVVKGVQMVLVQFHDILKRFSVERIQAQSAAFNPELHESVEQQAVAELAPNTVVKVYQEGYLLNGRLLRPARLVVSS